MIDTRAEQVELMRIVKALNLPNLIDARDLRKNGEGYVRMYLRLEEELVRKAINR